MKRIRILLANSHGIRRGVTKERIERHGIKVVEVPDPQDLRRAVREEGADAVIVALEDSKELDLCSQLLRDYPNLTILGLASDVSAFIEQLFPPRREIIDPSEVSILRSLRQAILAPCSSEEAGKASEESRE